MQVKIIIAIYFIGVLLVGLYSYFKIKSPQDYYVAGKKAGLLPVSGSLLATILGGSAILGTIELSREMGWPALWFLFCAAFGLLLLVPISKYVKRYGNYTLPEMLGVFYGKKVEIISSSIIPLAWLGIVAAQIIAAAKILNALGFSSYNNAAIFAGAIFMFYTLAGGQLSILKTDTFQSFLIVAGLAALVAFSFESSKSAATGPLTFTELFNPSFSVFDLVVLLLTYSVTFVVGPDIYSRVFCAKDEKTARRSIFITALLLVPISFALTWLGIFSMQVHETDIASFAQHLLPNWAYGLFMAALLSAVMSSADTTLLTSSMIMSELTGGNLNNIGALRRTRFFIILIGIASIAIAIFVTSIIQSLLFALTLFSGAFVVPTLAGLLGVKVNRKYILIAIVSGGSIALLGKITHDFFHENLGNLFIIGAYITQSALLFSAEKK